MSKRSRGTKGRGGRGLAAGDYQRFMTLLKHDGGRGPLGGKASDRINEGPYEIAELMDLFATMPAAELAGAWVGLLMDCYITFEPPPPGPLARALNVVATRLHGVSDMEVSNESATDEQPGPALGRDEVAGGGGADPL